MTAASQIPWRRISLMIALIFLTPGCGAPDPPATPPPVDPLVLLPDFEAELSLMTNLMHLPHAEQDPLREAFLERQNGLRAWLEGPGQRLMALEARMKEDAEAKDLDAIRATIAEATPLRGEFRNKIAEYDQSILNALSPERQLQWQGYQVANHFIGLSESLGLSAEQQSYLRAGAVDLFHQQTQMNALNPKAAAYLELERWAEAQVLTPEQVQAYQAVKAKHAMRSLTF